jgi:uncharacterized alkaline shock family protein YloU
VSAELAPGVRITDGALSQIVVTAAESVGGARVRRPRRRVEVSVEDGKAHVEVQLTAQYGARLQEVGRAVQERVADALRTMCSLEPAAIDVSVEERE